MCAIKFSDDNSYLTLKDHAKGEIRKTNEDNTPGSKDRYFLAADAGSGSGKITIFNVGNQKYLKKDGHHAHANADTNCGDECHFTIGDISTAAPTTSAPTITTGLLIKIYITNRVYIKLETLSINYSFFILECGFPKNFAFKAHDGKYCGMTGQVVKCDSTSISNNHKFSIITKVDDGSIKSGKCAIRSGNGNSYLKVDKNENNEVRKTNTPNGNAQYFSANNIKTGKVCIKNFLENKYLILEKPLLKAPESDCQNGKNEMHFTLEEINAPAGMLTKSIIINIVYIKHYSRKLYTIAIFDTLFSCQKECIVSY